MFLYKQLMIVALVASISLVTGAALAQSPAIGVSNEEVAIASKGWSITKHVLNKDVYTDQQEKLGTIEDIIVIPNDSRSYAIVSTGGFLGMAKHDIIIPINQFKLMNSRIVLPKATKDIIKDMPEFKPEN